MKVCNSSAVRSARGWATNRTSRFAPQRSRNGSSGTWPCAPMPNSKTSGERLSPGIEELPFIDQKHFARIEILQSAQPLFAAIDADHPPMGNEQPAEFGRPDAATFAGRIAWHDLRRRGRVKS